MSRHPLGLKEEDERRILGTLEALKSTGETVPEAAREAAVAVLLTGSSLASYEVLLMRRAFRETDRWSGQIGLPGGHAEDFDEDLIATARRESQEEVGVDPLAHEHARHLGALPAVQARSGAQRLPLYITPCVFFSPEVTDPVCGPEADEAFWLPIHPAHGGDFDEPYRYEHEGLVHKLPSWRFEDRVIWGMTHGILSRFFGGLFEPGADARR